MSVSAPKSRDAFASTLGAFAATLGSAIGLGNIWKFPYLTGSNGGAAFVLVYLLAIAFVGIPILVVELTIGRKMRASAVRACMAAVGIKGELAFVPQSAPMVRGIFASLQFPLPAGMDLDGLRARAQDVFRDAPLVRLVADSPRVGAVAGSAFADLSVAARDGSGVVLCAIDNLGKGMAAQAVQNMNLALGLEETLGLRIPGRYPG